MKRILSLLILLPTLAFAWIPAETISVTVGYTAGSQNELMFRKLMEVVVKNNPSVKFVITNRPGGDGVVSNNFLVTQPANGYHIGLPSITATILTNDLWQKDIKKYSWENCSIPVVLGETHIAVVASNKSSVNNFQEFISLLKNPDHNINIATAGGSLTLAYEYLMYQTNTNSNKDAVVQVKYITTPQVAVAVAGDQTEFGLTVLGAVTELAKDKRLKILAVASNTPFGNYPMARSNQVDFSITNGVMLMLPPGTPTDIVQWYELEFGRAIRSIEYSQWADGAHISINANHLTDKNVKTYLSYLTNKFSKLTRTMDIK